METSGEKIRRARKARGWSQKRLGQEVGTSQPAIKKIEANDTRQSKYLPAIAHVLELSLPDLMPDAHKNGKSATVGIGKSGRTPAQTNDQQFPIFASAEGGPGALIVSTDAFTYHDWPAHLRHVRDAYGILISGTSMEPEFRAGETAIVNPRLPVTPGDVFIFYAEKEGEGRAMIKELRRATDATWYVKQHNPPEGQKAEFTLDRREWRWAHRVVDKRSRW